MSIICLQKTSIFPRTTRLIPSVTYCTRSICCIEYAIFWPRWYVHLSTVTFHVPENWHSTRNPRKQKWVKKKIEFRIRDYFARVISTGFRAFGTARRQPLLYRIEIVPRISTGRRVHGKTNITSCTRVRGSQTFYNRVPLDTLRRTTTHNSITKFGESVFLPPIRLLLLIHLLTFLFSF